MNLAAIAVYAPPPSAVCQPPACLDAPVWNLVLAEVLGCPVTVCPDRYVAFSPVTHVSPDDPPIMLVNSVGDLIVPVGQAQAMAARLQVAGVPTRLLPVPGELHGGYDDIALEPSLAFLRTELERVAAPA
jgi:dipeptidyl aminopeptidase/acylaminoacyl peptidase